MRVFPSSDSSIKHIDVHEAVFCAESDFYHFSGINCKRKTEDVICKEIGCATRIWSIEFTAYSTVTRERKLYDISCNLLKNKLTEQIFPYGTLRAGDIEGSDVEPTTLRADDFEGRRL